MDLPLRIAFRYFKGKKSTQAIQVVSWISIGAVALSTTAMVVLFSIYNGLESYVKDMYTAFYPEVKVMPATGKFFTVSSNTLERLKQIKGVNHLGISVEDMALLEGFDHQKVVRLKGVNNDWFLANGMEKYVNTGTASWPEEQGLIPSNIGVGIAAEMGIDASNPYTKIQLYYPKANASFTGMDIANALNGLVVSPYATFAIQPELDNSYFLIPLQSAQNFFDVGNKISAIEISLNDPSYLKTVQNEVKNIVGDKTVVLSRIEQNKTLFMATQMEKWMIYGILFLVLILASFNMVGALSMLAIEKKLDISILKTMGVQPKAIRKVLLYLSLIIAGVGGLLGLILGLIIVLSQQQWGWLKMGDGFLDTYPVQLQGFDFIVVCLTVLFVGLAAGWFPARKASKQKMIFRDE